jgi:alkylhydroperoxidase/carboxymuconolactone decarboxylase family protein YurZ
MTLTERQRELREEFIDTFGYWHQVWDDLLVADAEFFQTYVELAAVPWRHGHLAPKVKEMVQIAVDGAATHLYAPGLRQHIKNALALGATKEELMEVLELTSTLGIHACNIGVPILMEELAGAGVQFEKSLSPRQQELKADFETKRGYWNAFWDDVLTLDPDFFESYLHFSSVPWVSGVLSPKLKELIYTAFDVSATHLYESGLRQHIRNALAYGATREEVMEVFQLATTIGIHSCNLGVALLREEEAVAAAASGGRPAQ